MYKSILTQQQLALLEFAAIDAILFTVSTTSTRVAQRLVKYGLLSSCTRDKITLYLITPKGRIWARRLGLIFLTNEQ